MTTRNKGLTVFKSVPKKILDSSRKLSIIFIAMTVETTAR